MKYPQGIFTFQRPFRVINFSTTAVLTNIPFIILSDYKSINKNIYNLLVSS